MTRDLWPSSEPPPAPSRLPRIEDLPLAENGYDRERVRVAFDSFYRHVAQLDATLRALEAVDAFSRQAAELRAELRALRSSGLGLQPWAPTYASRQSPLRDGISPAVVRLTAEAGFLVAVPVLARFADLRPLYIVGLAALAWTIVVLFEVLAYRSRFASPRAFAAPPVAEPEAEAPRGTGWAEVPAPVEEMTVIESAALGTTAAERELVAAEDAPVAEADIEPEPEPELEVDEPQRRWRLFRGREKDAPAEPEPPAAGDEADEQPLVEATAGAQSVELVAEIAPEPAEEPAVEAIEPLAEEPEPIAEVVEPVAIAEPVEPEPPAEIVEPAAPAEPDESEPQRRRGFWHRRREHAEVEEPVPVIDSTPVDEVVGTPPPPTVDPWETGPEFLSDLASEAHSQASAFTAEDEAIAEEPLTAERVSLERAGGNGAEPTSATVDGDEPPPVHPGISVRYPLRRGRRR